MATFRIKENTGILPQIVKKQPGMVVYHTTLIDLSSFTDTKTMSELVIIDDCDGETTVNLPPTTLYTGTLWIKNVFKGNSSNITTISPSAGNTIEIAGSSSLDDGVSNVIRSDGINKWYVISSA